MNLNQIHSIWIAPEIERRRAAGTLPARLELRRVLIRILPGRVAVEFNEEIVFKAKAQYTPTGQPRLGAPVWVHEINAIEEVEPPMLDGKRCCFIYLYVTGRGQYSSIFDFSPSWPDFEEDSWELGAVLAEALNRILSELTIKSHQGIRAKLHAFGLAPAPSIIPFPLNKVVKFVADDEEDRANQLLCAHCNPDWLEQRLESWLCLPHFRAREPMFRSALASHRRGDYIASLHILVPQLEGVVISYSLERVGGRHKGGPEGHAKRVRDAVMPTVPSDYTYQAVVDSTFALISSGPLYRFFNWQGETERTFPSRHAIAHGKSSPSDFTQGNSVKMLLLFDAVADIMQQAEATGRVESARQ